MRMLRQERAVDSVFGLDIDVAQDGDGIVRSDAITMANAVLNDGYRLILLAQLREPAKSHRGCREF